MHLDLYTRNIPLTRSLKDLAGRKVALALDRFAQRIGRLTLRLHDANGPKGGVDIQALALVDLREGTRLVVRGSYASPAEAVADIIDRVRSVVQRSQERMVHALHRG